MKCIVAKERKLKLNVLLKWDEITLPEWRVGRSRSEKGDRLVMKVKDRKEVG